MALSLEGTRPHDQVTAIVPGAGTLVGAATLIPLVVTDEMTLRAHIELLRAQVESLQRELLRRDDMVREARARADGSRAMLIKDIGVLEAEKQYAQERLHVERQEHQTAIVSRLLAERRECV